MHFILIEGKNLYGSLNEILKWVFKIFIYIVDILTNQYICNPIFFTSHFI